MRTDQYPVDPGWHQGTESVLQMQEIIKASNTEMRLMVASIRDISQIAYLSSHVSLYEDFR